MHPEDLRAAMPRVFLVLLVLTFHLAVAARIGWDAGGALTDALREIAGALL